MHPRIRELLVYLDDQRAVLRDAIDAVPPALRDRQPDAHCWSAAGIVEHLAIVEQRVGRALGAKIAAARAEDGPAETCDESILATIDVRRVLDRSTRVTAPDTAVPTGMPADEAWSALERAGATVREALASGDGLALDTITLVHPLFGPLSAYHWFAFLAAHEARHAAQIRDIVARAETR
jgi:DinB family protein